MSLLELTGLTNIFQKKNTLKPENQYPVWDSYENKTAEQPKAAAERLRFTKSSWEIKNCIKYLSQEYQQDWERYRAFEKIPPELVAQIVKAVFELYQTIILLESNETNFATFEAQLSSLHQLINDQSFNTKLGVFIPTRKYLEHLLQFTEPEKTALQKKFFDALLNCQPLTHTIDHSHYLGNDVIEFTSPLHSTVDTLFLTSSMREVDLYDTTSLEEMLLNLDYPASMFGFDAQKLPVPEQKRLLDLMILASPSFKNTDQSIEQLNRDNAIIYQTELCLFLLSNHVQPLIRYKAARGLLVKITTAHKLEQTPQLPSSLTVKIESSLVKFLENDYINNLPSEARSHYDWVRVLFDRKFFSNEFLPAVLKYVDLNFPDMLGMVKLTKLIAAYREQSKSLYGLQPPIKAAEFLAFCISGLEGKEFNTMLLYQLNPLNASPKVLVDLVIFSGHSKENSEALDWSPRSLAEAMTKVPLSQRIYTELVGLWVNHKNYEESNSGRNIERNLRRMILLEEAQPGCIEILLAEPFNIRFFDRYRQEDLLAMVKKTQSLKEKIPNKERSLYDPKKTIFLTTTWYDNNDAFYSKNAQKLIEDARKRGFDVIITEVNSPAQLFRSLKTFFLLNESQPFTTQWIFRAHGGVEGGIRMGSKNESASRILPTAVDKVMTQKMQTWFGSHPIQLILNSCYAGTHWVKQIGTKLNWHVVGQEGSAGLLLWFDKANIDNRIIYIRAGNEQGDVVPQVQFNARSQTTKVLEYGETMIH